MSEKITLEDIIEVHEMDTDEMKSYYHKGLNCMVVITENDLEFAKLGKDINEVEEWKRESIEHAKEYLENKDNFLEFPNVDDYKEESLIKPFINWMGDKLSEDIKREIPSDASLKEFKEVIFKHFLSDKWYEFRDEAFFEIARKWCIDNNIEYAE